MKNTNYNKLKYLKKKNIKIKSLKQFNYQCTTLFNLDIKNKSILEIGCGDGRFSLWASINGAKKIVCLEPEMHGSTQNSTKFIKNSIKILKLKNVKFIENTIQKYDNRNEKFDIIVLKNSINHLNEKKCIILQKNNEAKTIYIKLLKKIATMMKINGKIIITDCSRYNFFNTIGIKNIFSPSIEWHKHQTPNIWIELLLKAGFNNAKISWTVPYPIRHLKFILDNRFASYFIVSHFKLEMKYNN
jgi:SAM-dependent methyltransferase